MAFRILPALLICATVDSLACAQSLRVAYVPPTSLVGQEQDPRLLKLSPELADIVRRNATYLGQQRNGRLVVEGRAADLAGLKDPEPPEESRFILIHSEQFIVEYPPGQAPTAESINQAGFDLLSTNHTASFVVVAPIPPRANDVNRAPGIAPSKLLNLTQVPQALQISRNVILSIPDEEMKPAIVPAEHLRINTASGNLELDRVQGIKRTGADKVQSISDPSQVIVAVIDTGVEYNHSDLRDNMWVNQKEIPGNNIDDDNNGVVDDRFGARFVNGRISGDPRDDNGHGTHCAGTIAAVANGHGVVGMAQTKIMALKFLTLTGSGLTSDAVRCIDYARENGAKIISNSWGGLGPIPPVLEKAIERARLEDILFVVAAGNDNRNIDTIDYSPANSVNENVLTVGAVNFAGRRSGFSNFGLRNVDIGAPGGTGAPGSDDDILSTWIHNDYAYLPGTSMATPHVSGAAALLLGTPKFSRMSFFDLKKEILDNAQKNPQLVSSWKDGRELDVSFLLKEPPVVPPEQPSEPVPEKEFYFATAKEFASPNGSSSDATLITRRLILREKATINLFASASAAGVSGSQTFVTGISIGDAAHKPSFRIVTSGGRNEYVTFGTSLSTTLEAGIHDVNWWIRLPKNGRLAVRGGGYLDAQAFAISR